MPLWAFFRASQTASVPMPTEASMPTPVTTTLRCNHNSVVIWNGRYFLALLLFIDLCLNVVDGVLDGRDLFGVLVGNIEVETFLERHHQLDNIKRVGAEIIDETGGGINLCLIHTK